MPTTLPERVASKPEPVDALTLAAVALAVFVLACNMMTDRLAPYEAASTASAVASRLG